ncbi:hypothetical protein PTSG_12367 [Salpingoeca rosetta]|uniref:Rubicon Homology domain-containing protein n=1 Tax=Salpingoeca rosetta (strain ATCC 50818 / BSB-021) TaxID=946362 RepID=F2UD64_SALR5|nr:uncharacterized protein PTSG_12367 [Salpingoeca rosetta]EGD74559.1 hypothetical protein PTSG_12367 [Salpingoeca rosetta]|eukprot:XP_004992816.1 hypothetical protein PTSG_12367 [Salpingoeca rosetta]
MDVVLSQQHSQHGIENVLDVPDEEADGHRVRFINDDLDRENLHFRLSEAVIQTMEANKPGMPSSSFDHLFDTSEDTPPPHSTFALYLPCALCGPHHDAYPHTPSYPQQEPALPNVPEDGHDVDAVDRGKQPPCQHVQGDVANPEYQHEHEQQAHQQEQEEVQEVQHKHLQQHQPQQHKQQQQHQPQQHKQEQHKQEQHKQEQQQQQKSKAAHVSQPISGQGRARNDTSTTTTSTATSHTTATTTSASSTPEEQGDPSPVRPRPHPHHHRDGDDDAHGTTHDATAQERADTLATPTESNAVAVPSMQASTTSDATTTPTAPLRTSHRPSLRASPLRYGLTSHSEASSPTLSLSPIRSFARSRATSPIRMAPRAPSSSSSAAASRQRPASYHSRHHLPHHHQPHSRSHHRGHTRSTSLAWTPEHLSTSLPNAAAPHASLPVSPATSTRPRAPMRSTSPESVVLGLLHSMLHDDTHSTSTDPNHSHPHHIDRHRDGGDGGDGGDGAGDTRGRRVHARQDSVDDAGSTHDAATPAAHVGGTTGRDDERGGGAGGGKTKEGGDDASEQRLVEIVSHQPLLPDNHAAVPQRPLRPPSINLRDLRASQRELRNIWHPSIRGNDQWAPPRHQVIYHVNNRAAVTRADAMKQQGYRCYNCGLKVEISHLFQKFRWCEYTGKYFCTSCHKQDKAFIPARIVHFWDFRRYPVSKFAAEVLVSIKDLPVFDLQTINPRLLKRISSLRKMHLLRVRLKSLRDYLCACSNGEHLLSLLGENDNMATSKSQYSLMQLVKVKSGQLYRDMAAVCRVWEDHVMGCPRCLGLGHICEFCNNDRDLLFPFQIQRIHKCPECKAISHARCFAKRKQCPRCERRRRYRARSARLSTTSTTGRSGYDGGGGGDGGDGGDGAEKRQ